MFLFSFQVCVLCVGPTSCGITSGAAVCITWIFQERHPSSAKCCGSCCVLRGTAIFPVTFRSATPSAVGACPSVQLPKSCVWMHVKHKKQMWMPKQLIKLVLLYTCRNAEETFFVVVVVSFVFFLLFFYWCWYSSLAKSTKWSGCLADIGAEAVWQAGNKNVTQKKVACSSVSSHTFYISQ